MARLFITPREIDFINDLNKEIIKDVIGQKIYYYSISFVKSRVHDVYQESVEKIFEKPVEVDALVQWNPEDVTTNKFGTEEITRLEVFLHQRDLNDKEIQISVGDFFSYGTQFFEITSHTTTSNIYGQIEYPIGTKIIGRESRRGNFISRVIGPSNEMFTDPDAIQDEFYQQRGYANNQAGETGDIRELQKNNVLEEPLTGPSEVSPKGTDSEASAAFYDEQD